MVDANGRQPADDESMHPIPRDKAGLATTQECAVPEPSYLESKQMQRVVVHGLAVIAIAPSNYGSQPLAYFGGGMVHASSEFDLPRRVDQKREKDSTFINRKSSQCIYCLISRNSLSFQATSVPGRAICWSFH